MSSVYCVFQIFYDGDGYTQFELIGIYNDFNKCIDDVATLEVPNRMNPIFPSMTNENNYTVIKKRKDCPVMCEGFSTGCGGYIIESIELNKIN